MMGRESALDLRSIKRVLKELRVRPHRSMGQNFLFDESILDIQVEQSCLSPEDRVLEVGPGLGFLTSKLLETGASVIAVEKDRRLFRYLEKGLAREYENLTLIHGDFLKTDLGELGNKRDTGDMGNTGDTRDTRGMGNKGNKGNTGDTGDTRDMGNKGNMGNMGDTRGTRDMGNKGNMGNMGDTGDTRDMGNKGNMGDTGDLRDSVNIGGVGNVNKVVSNPPYSLSTPITLRLQDMGIELAVMMYQYVFAKRIAARPGTRDHSRLSVSCQYHFSPELVRKVSRNVFYPRPKVDSAIVRLVRRKEKEELADRRIFDAVIRAAFSYRRKKLKNALGNSRNPAVRQSVGDDALKPFMGKRAGELSVEDYVYLANHVATRSRSGPI